jgi:hypothetical protein
MSPDEAKRAYAAFEGRFGRVPPDVHPDSGTWVVVNPGYALAPVGDEIYVPCPIFVDTAREWADGTLVTSPADCCPVPGMKSLSRADGDWYLVAEAWEEEGGAVRTASARCGDHPEQFEFSRVADTFAFRLVAEQPREPFEDITSMTGREQRLAGTPKRSHVWLGTLQFSGGRVQVLTDPRLRDPTLPGPFAPKGAGPAEGTSVGPTAAVPPALERARPYLDPGRLRVWVAGGRQAGGAGGASLTALDLPLSLSVLPARRPNCSSA